MFVERIHFKQKLSGKNKETEIVSISEKKDLPKNNETNKDCKEVSNVLTDLLSKVVLSVNNDKNEENNEESSDESDNDEQVPQRYRLEKLLSE